jgi:CRP-like cAMP-binding protein
VQACATDALARGGQASYRSEARARLHPVLLKAGLLAPLTQAEKAALADAAARIVLVEADQDIVPEGQASTECRVLLTGWSARYKLLPQGQRQIVAFGLPGDFLDLDAFATEAAPDHAVAALQPCSVGIIPHQTLREIAEEHAGVARALWRHTLLDAAIGREWVTNIGRRSAKVRIAHLICETSTRLGTVGRTTHQDEERTLPWPVTQSELADATGLSPVHVNRSLQALRRDGLLISKGLELHIKDWPGLARLAAFDPAYLGTSA